MIYEGIDIHKRYSVVSLINERGECLETQRVMNEKLEFERIMERYRGERFRAVIEAGLNWGVIYDMLSEIEGMESMKVANASQIKAIASAKIKTDRIDSKILGQLLRLDFIPEIYVPDKRTRVLKDIIRYRLFIVRLKTTVKNKIHDILLKSRVMMPEVKDIFGKYGMEFLERVELPDRNADLLLRHNLELYKKLVEEEKEISSYIEKEVGETEEVRLLRSIPGIGKVFGQLIALEIKDINRFPSVKHLCSYCGLVPSTHSSGTTSYHGKLIKGNKWLRWALARKLVAVVYHVLKEKRKYFEFYPNYKDRLPSDGDSRRLTPDSCQE